MGKAAKLKEGDRVSYAEHGDTDTGTVLEVQPVVTVWVKVRWDNDCDALDPDQTDWYLASQLNVSQ